MGGSLASEAAILLSRICFSHNILGIIGLDVPFLGVHPHVVASGVTGLLKPATPAGPAGPVTPAMQVVIPLDRPTAEYNLKTKIQEGIQTGRLTTEDSTPVHPISRTPSPTENSKPNFKSTFAKTVTSIYKHRHDLGTAAPRYLWSHLEYGHILLDPEELKSQYHQLRRLPINFVNYYTFCVSHPEKKGRVFCSLPGGDMSGWEKVEMVGEWDEPTAHSAIFLKDRFDGYWDFLERMAEKVSSWEV